MNDMEMTNREERLNSTRKLANALGEVVICSTTADFQRRFVDRVIDDLVGGECCPICGYMIAECQCRFGGSAHPDRHLNATVVKDHLHLLTPSQLEHVIDLERFWQTSYGDDERTRLLENLETHGTTEPPTRRKADDGI